MRLVRLPVAALGANVVSGQAIGGDGKIRATGGLFASKARETRAIDAERCSGLENQVLAFMSLPPAAAAAAAALGDDDSSSEPPRALAQLTKEYKYWMEANLVKELSSLRSAGKAIRGVYVMPSHETLQVWHGCLFLHSGIFAGACFKFVMTFPETTEGQPEVRPPHASRFPAKFHDRSLPPNSPPAAGRVRQPVHSPPRVVEGPRGAGEDTHKVQQQQNSSSRSPV